MAIDGTYKLTAKSLLGKMEGQLVLKYEDGVLSGTVDGMGMNGTIRDGSFDGKNFTCVLEGDGPTGPMTLDTKGTIVGDHITGSLKAGAFTIKFQGDRV